MFQCCAMILSAMKGIIHSAMSANALVVPIILVNSVVLAEDWSPMWTTGTLSQPRYLLSATSAGGKAFFGGGYLDNYIATSVVDVYDSSTEAWSTMNMLQRRHALAAASVDNRVFFGGGGSNTTVDVYNMTTNTWSTTLLSQMRSYLAAASCGSKVAFGGGYASGQIPYPYASAVVDIYDTTDNTWSTTSLSQARYNLAAASVGNQILFAGGEGIQSSSTPSARVDVYNVDSNTWSMGTLSQARYRLAGSSVGTKILFGGGWAGPGLPSSKVDIYDSAEQSWFSTNLSQAREDLAAASVGDRVLFAGGHLGDGVLSNVVDIYNSTTNTWTKGTLSQARNQLAATTVGNKVFFAGGVSKWNTVVSTISNVIDIYTLQNYATITSAKTFTLVDQTIVAGRMQLNSGASLNLDGYNLAVGSMGGVAPINLSTHTLTTGSDNTDSTYSGTISGAGSLAKTGSGVLTLSGPNIYTGTTIVNNGTLWVNGSLVSPVSVLAGMLGGSGTISGAVNVGSAALAPGSSPATLTIANKLALSSTSTLAFDLCGMDTTVGNSVNTLIQSLTGLTLDGTLNVTETMPGSFLSATSGEKWRLINYTGTLSDNGLTLGMMPKLGDGLYFAVDTSTAGQVSLKVVPEPGTLALLATGLISLLAYARQWRRRGV
jgi:autotransporter-associated beta strand protein